MKQALNPGVVTAIIVVVVAAVVFFLYKGTSSGPVEGSKETMPEAMRKAYEHGPGGGGAPPAKP